MKRCHLSPRLSLCVKNLVHPGYYLSTDTCAACKTAIMCLYIWCVTRVYELVLLFIYPAPTNYHLIAVTTPTVKFLLARLRFVRQFGAYTRIGALIS